MELQIIIDDGSNFIKTAHKVDGEIKINSFPSRVNRSPQPAKGFEGSFTSGAYTLNGNKFCVVESANGVIPTSYREYQTSDVNAVLVHHALREAGATSAHVVLTIPVAHYYTPDREKNEALIKAKEDNLKKQVLPMDDGRACATIKSVKVLPEGIPAFVHAKTSLNLEDGKYLIADIGGTTTDMVVFDENGVMQKCASLEVGGLTLLDKFRAYCEFKLGISQLSDSQIMQGLLTGRLLKKDMKKEAEQCINEFKVNLMDNIGKLGDIRSFDGVILSGGGALLMDSEDNDFLITDSPQFDNVYGALSIFK